MFLKMCLAAIQIIMTNCSKHPRSTFTALGFAEKLH
jgi:hypothetical protein